MKEEHKQMILSYIEKEINGEIEKVEITLGNMWIETKDKTYSLTVFDTEEENEDDYRPEQILDALDPYWSRLIYKDIEKATGVQLFGLNDDQLEVELMRAKRVWDSKTIEEKQKFYLETLNN